VASRSWIDKDFYAALGVPKGASTDDIKKAYRKLVMQYHPDRNQGNPEAEERFKQISEAYDVLANPEKRREYDQLREAAASGFPGGFRMDDLGDEFDIEDFLQTVFGGRGGFGGFGGRRNVRTRGSDVEGTVSLSFEEAALGAERTLTLEVPVACGVCNGAGGTDPKTCPTCQGRGTVANSQGPFAFSQTCSTCRGRGTVTERPCSGCGGAGVRRERRNVTVKIPPGISDGGRVRVRGRGEAGSGGGAAGDLYVRVQVKPHPFFGRKGQDLTLTLPVTFSEAALGSQVKVPTLTEPVTLKIPPGTSSGKTFRIRGRGIPKRGGGAGDLLATVQVAVPKKLSRKQRELVEQLEDDEAPRAHLGV